MIPKIIHQVWVGPKVPSNIQKLMDDIKEKTPGFEYKFWSEKELEAEFKKEYVQNTINKALHVVFATDDFRLKILEKFGGIYLDADTKIMLPIDKLYQKYKNKKLVSVKDGRILPDLGVIFAEKGIDYSFALVDYNFKGPFAFYWQRMKPEVFDKEEVGREGRYLKDTSLNSWVPTYQNYINEKSTK
jgi:hypothetical protein